MNVREQFLLDNNLLQIPNPVLTKDIVEPSDRFLNLFIKHYYLDQNENVEESLSWAYMKILKIKTNSVEDIILLKSYCAKYFRSVGIS